MTETSIADTVIPVEPTADSPTIKLGLKKTNSRFIRLYQR
jgi:hypothetical protein